MYSLGWTIIMLCLLRFRSGETSVVQVTSANIQSILESNELVLLKFYTNECIYSRQLIPIYMEAAELVKQKFPQAGQVALGRINVDEEMQLANDYHIVKYPTIKLIHRGYLHKREYRGQRSATAILDFVEHEIKDPVKVYTSLDELKFLSFAYRHIACYMHDKNSVAYEVFHRVALKLKHECYFYAGFGDIIDRNISDGRNKIVYQADYAAPFAQHEAYEGDMENFDELFAWADEKCNPLVIQITYDNAEELTEYRLPFVMLIHEGSDADSLKEFRKIVYEQLHDMKGTVLFVTGEEIDFMFPLAVLELGRSDLPAILVDNLEQTYIYSNFSDMHLPGNLRQFIKSSLSKQEDFAEITIPTAASQLKLLQPSKHRYSLRNRDEL